MKLSFCLITLNEQDNLARCLKSFADLADEIVIVDSGSTDGTEAIARDFNARWLHQDWLGYVGQKNVVLSCAQNEWVFSIDADEELSPQLRAEVQALKRSDATNHVSGYSVPRCVLYEGKWIRHGDWYPDRLTRIFRRERARFAGGRVHERLEIEGPIASLNGDLHHYSFKSAEDHRLRCEKYARLWAETQAEAGRTANFLSPYSHAAFRWLRGYILRRGFLDGRQGWQIAKYSAQEVHSKYQILRDLKLK